MNTTFLYVITVLIWGSTWIAINYQLGDVSPATSLFYRFGLAAIVLFFVCKFSNVSLKQPLKHHLQFAMFGLTLFGCNYYFLYNAQQHINSALTCIAFSTIMIFNMINARIWYNTKITQQVYFGGALGLVGITTLFWPQINDVSLGAQTLTGLAFGLIGAIFASTGNMLSIKNQEKNIPLHAANAWGMTYGALAMGIWAVIQGASFNIPMTTSYISSLLYLSIFGSVIAFGSYLTLLNRIGAHKASYASIMFPAVAVIISSFVESFQWTTFTVVGLGFIFIGNWVVLSKPKVKIKHQNLIDQKAIN